MHHYLVYLLNSVRGPGTSKLHENCLAGFNYCLSFYRNLENHWNTYILLIDIQSSICQTLIGILLITWVKLALIKWRNKSVLNIYVENYVAKGFKCIRTGSEFSNCHVHIENSCIPLTKWIINFFWNKLCVISNIRK